MVELDRRAKTYRLELRRAVANGVLESAGSTFLLLIAVRWFHIGATAKGLVAAGGSVGLMLTPLVVSQVARLQWPAAVASSRMAAAGAACFSVMALLPWPAVFVVGSIAAMAASSAAVPLMTQVYQENYPESERGKLFSRAIMIRIAAAAIFSDLAGRWLSSDLANFRPLLLVFAVAFACASFWLGRCPSTPLIADVSSHPFRAMRFAREDRLFRHTLICWMLMGFANLMMLPLRVEYLAGAKYGLALDVALVAQLTGVIPNLARLAMSPIWGRLFDQMNFFALRVTLNIGFAVGILTFFLSDTSPGLIAGAVIYGISNAGGDVAWGLWVTKFAPPERVADYMSVHTFFTGLRGVAAPLISFNLVSRISLPTLGYISAGLILAATLMLLPEVKLGRQIRRGTRIVEESSS